MKIVYNETHDNYTNIEDFLSIYSGEAKQGGLCPYAVIFHSRDKASAPLAFFSEKADAEKCARAIVLFASGQEPLKGYKVTKEGFLVVRDKVKETLIHVPENLKR